MQVGIPEAHFIECGKYSKIRFRATVQIKRFNCQSVDAEWRQSLIIQ